MKVISIDLGATSGRVMTVSYEEGLLSYKEYFRFINRIHEVDGKLCWDFSFLMENILQGIKNVLKENKDIASIGIDTWAVDYGVLDEKGNLIKDPMCYRDPSTFEAQKKLQEKMPFKDIYAITGIQDLHFNTIYQLYQDKEVHKPNRKMLMIPDLIAYYLTGEMRMEVSNASTTSLYNRRRGRMDERLLSLIHVDKSLFAPFIKPTERYGYLKNIFLPVDYTNDIPVIATATHDTASAVLGTNGFDNFAYLSSGTWSLIGTELKHPIITEDSYKANFTNEIGFDDTIRFLKNTMGMFLINETRKDLANIGEDIPNDRLVSLVYESKEEDLYLDTNDPLFETPGDMLYKIQGYLKKTHQNQEYKTGQLLKAIYQSMAFSYKTLLLELERITKKEIKELIVVGGGNQAEVLNQFTANALNKKVITGPIEATVIGNALAQFIALGAIKNVKEGREAITKSLPSRTYVPTDSRGWEKKYDDYLRITKSKAKEEEAA